MRPRAVPWLGAFVAALVALTAFAPARADDGLTTSIASIDDSQFPTTRIVISAELNGQVLPALEAANVSVTDNGAAARVTRITRATDASIPANVIAVVDVSGSMRGEKLARAKEALITLVRNLEPADRFALIAFSENVQVVAPLSGNREGLEAVIGALEAGGNTALYGAVAEAARVAGSSGTGRNVVILLGDGEDFGNRSGVTADRALELAVASRAPFYVIGLGGEIDRTYMARVAAQTGGRYIDAPTAADLQAGYTAIEDALKGQFIVTVESTAPATPLERTITVKVTSAGRTAEASRTFTSSRQVASPTAAGQTATATAQATAPAGEAVPPAPAEDDGGTGTIRAVAGVLAVGFVLAAGALVFIGWRARVRHVPVVPAEESPLAAMPAARPGTPVVAARFALLGEDGSELVLAGEPVTLGANGGAPPRDAPHARIWVRDGRVMLHNVGASALVNGQPVEWVSLEDGDRVEVGERAYRLARRE